MLEADDDGVELEALEVGLTVDELEVTDPELLLEVAL